MEEKILYLSKDKSSVIDDDGNVVYVRKDVRGKTFYEEPASERGGGKVCVSFEPRKICVDWDDKHYCIGWDTIEVCVKWESDKSK